MGVAKELFERNINHDFRSESLKETVKVEIICSPEGNATGCFTNGGLSSDS